jgi:signal transduction histidine kinase
MDSGLDSFPADIHFSSLPESACAALDPASGRWIWTLGMYHLLEEDPKRVIASPDVYFSACHPEDISFVERQWQQFRESRQKCSFNHRLQLKTKGIKHVKVTLSCAEDQKTPLLFFWTVRDVTETDKLARIEGARIRLLELSRDESLSAILQATLDEVSSLTESEVAFYHFVESDGRSLSLQAWSSRTVKEFCQALGAGFHYDLDQAGVWADCVREGQPVIHNDYMSLPNRKGLPPGHAPVIRELVVPIFRGGKPVAILGVGNKGRDYDQEDLDLVTNFADMAWDIADRLRLLEERRELSRMAERHKNEQSLGRMAAAVAHHYNNMLTAVQGNLDLLRRELHGNPRAAEFAEEAYRATRRAARLGSEMLTYLGFQRGRQELVNLAAVVGKTLGQLESPEEIEIVQDLPLAGPYVKGSPEQLSDLVLQLLKNSLEAMESDSGTIRVELGRSKMPTLSGHSHAPLDWKPEDAGFASLRITDTGKGITKDVRERMFDPFFSTHQVGRGLGLSIVTGILRSHHGVIIEEDEDEPGTTFCCYLPLVKQEDGAAMSNLRRN